MAHRQVRAPALLVGMTLADDMQEAILKIPAGHGARLTTETGRSGTAPGSRAARRWEPNGSACASSLSPAPRRQRPPPAAPPRRTMALGRRGHRRCHLHASHPTRLTSRNRRYDQEGHHPGPWKPPTRRDSRAGKHARRLKTNPSRTPQATTGRFRGPNVSRPSRRCCRCRPAGRSADYRRIQSAAATGHGASSPVSMTLIRSDHSVSMYSSCSTAQESGATSVIHSKRQRPSPVSKTRMHPW